jgi:nitroreductase
MARSYSGEPVPREAVERIVGVVLRAPSAGFSQGHRLVVVTEPATRLEIAQLSGEDEYAALGHARWMSSAPVHVVIGVREESYHERYRAADKLRDGDEIEWPVPYWYVDAGSLFLLVQLAALDEGLATGIFGAPAERVTKLRALVGLPEDVHFVCVLTIGWPGDEAAEPPSSRVTRRRLPVEELVAWERWDASG